MDTNFIYNLRKKYFDFSYGQRVGIEPPVCC